MSLPASRADTGRVGECCDHAAYDGAFGDRFARRIAQRCRRHGLNRTGRRIVDVASTDGIRDATVLEIGGGVGELHLELLRRGARAATSLEISTGYETEAARLLDGSGLEGRVTRRFLDIATAPDEVEAADVVVLHRVVCCYPDYEALLSAAASRARRLLVFSYPPRNILSRSIFGFRNRRRQLRRNDFRAFVHPPAAMVAVAEAHGMTVRYRHPGTWWSVVGLERTAAPAAADSA